MDLTVEDLTAVGNIIQLGYEPVRINIMTPAKGVDFSDIWRQQVSGPYGRLSVNYIDRENLIKLKKTSNRTQDKADLELLLSDRE